jgi:uncharacterized protein (TIGR02452 family)
METFKMNQLTILPCLDNDEMAASRKHELSMLHHAAEALGRSAVEAADRGRYVAESGKEVFWKSAVEFTKSAKLSIPPELDLPRSAGVSFPRTIVQVSNETTLGAGKRLVDRGLRPLALNFANGVNPGGGFLTGARAQEEVLCRSSALFPTILGDPMYESHRRRPRPDSTDWAILSPDVPVFREDNGRALEQPWLSSFITCAAPYAPGVGQPESGSLLQCRIHRVLEIARAYGYVTLVLGAWGCGAFQNDPARTAKDFHSALECDFCGAFDEVVFAITDWSSDRRYLGPFRDVFAEA